MFNKPQNSSSPNREPIVLALRPIYCVLEMPSPQGFYAPSFSKASRPWSSPQAVGGDLFVLVIVTRNRNRKNVPPLSMRQASPLSCCEDSRGNQVRCSTFGLLRSERSLSAWPSKLKVSQPHPPRPSAPPRLNHYLSPSVDIGVHLC
jgi:hypothetical protein